MSGRGATERIYVAHDAEHRHPAPDRRGGLPDRAEPSPPHRERQTAQASLEEEAAWAPIASRRPGTAHRQDRRRGQQRATSGDVGEATDEQRPA